MQTIQPPERFETPRLILRRSRLDDVPAIFERYHQDSEVTRYLTWRPSTAVDQTYSFLRRCEARWESGESFPWVITMRGYDTPIGMLELRIQGHRADMGYVLAQAYWNRGYMTEAVRVVTEWALSQASIFRVWAVCDVENVASVRMLKKAGFQQEGILRRWIIHPNIGDEPRDCYCYAVVK